MSDAAFADALFANAEQALKGFELTAKEIAKFKDISRAEFTALSTEERKSMGGDFWSKLPKHNQSTLSGFN